MHEENRVVAHNTLQRCLLLLSSRVLAGPRCHPSMLTSHHLKGCPRRYSRILNLIDVLSYTFRFLFLYIYIVSVTCYRNCWFRTLASSWHGQDRSGKAIAAPCSRLDLNIWTWLSCFCADLLVSILLCLVFEPVGLLDFEWQVNRLHCSICT